MDNIAKVSAALVRAQRAFGPALKTSSNPHFKSRYADLSACVEAVIDALNAEGIALVQRQHPSDGGVAVETLFVHESGEVFSSGILHMPASKKDAQGYGSALTYARRYSLMAAAGIAPEDDDGNAASNSLKKQAASGSGGPRQIIFSELPPDWQSWLIDLANECNNAFASSGVSAAQALIDDATEKNQLEDAHINGLYSKLDSKLRAQLKAPKTAKEAT